MLRDLKNHLNPAPAHAPAARVNGTSTGAAVDLRGFSGAMIAFQFGAWTDGTHTPSAQHSTDGTTFTACGTTDLDGTLAAVSGTAGQNAVQRVGYKGGQRYVQPMIVTAGATTGALSASQVVRGYPDIMPT